MIKPDHCANQREIVEQAAAPLAVLGRTARVARAGLRPGRDEPDGAPAHAAGAELEVAVEAVVEFAPLPALDEFVEALLRPARQAGLQPRVQVLHGAGQQFSLPGGLGDFLSGSHEMIFFNTEDAEFSEEMPG